MKTSAAMEPRIHDTHCMSGSVADSESELTAAQIPTPSTENQQQTMGALLTKTMQNGDEWYLIDSRWFNKWKEYVEQPPQSRSRLNPGAIDNSGLFSDHETQVLKKGLQYGQDYNLVPTEAWNKLVSWYGCLEGQRAIVRKVVKQGMFITECIVEVYLLELTLCEIDKMDKVITFHFSRADTIGTLEKEMRSLFQIPTEKETRLCLQHVHLRKETLAFTKGTMCEQLDKPHSTTLQDACLYKELVVVIEQMNEDGTWPTGLPLGHPKSSTATGPSLDQCSARVSIPATETFSTALVISPVANGVNSSNSSSTSHNNGYSWPRYDNNYHNKSEPGLCGLNNLGNTCFMNSALQCLSNASPLTQYFLDDKYGAEINRENPLGMKGEIAEAYADLVKNMWKKNRYVSPQDFKKQVGRFAPQFSGYQQQDSQELLAFLLDGLHEDLNRVKKKPYLDLRDVEGRPDETVAKEAWTDHRKRNDSIIVDIFHGLFKSTLVCPECSKVSVTFDPFCYLSLPLPMSNYCTMEVVLVRSDPQSRPTKYRVVVPKVGTVMDLCSALSQLCGIPPESMMVADVYNHSFYKIFKRGDGLDQIIKTFSLVKIFVYEVQEEDSEMSVPVYFIESRWYSGRYTTPFGLPLLITVPRQNLTADVLYDKILERMGRYVKHPQSPCSESRALASATFTGCSQAAEFSTPSCHNTNMSCCCSPLSDGASCSASYCNGRNHSGACEEQDMDDQASSLEAENGSEEDEDKDTSNGLGDDEEAGMDYQASLPEPANGSEEKEDKETSDFKNGPEAKLCSTSPKLFTLMVNTQYGTLPFNGNTLGTLPFNGNTLKLDPRSTVTLDWHSETKALCYDHQEAKAFETHDSMLQPKEEEATVALRTCIKLFTTTETLGKHDPWFCPTCKKHQQATKKFDLWSLPRILVVHLKRFSYNQYYRDKLETVVDFPVRELDMSEFLCDPKAAPCVYDLIAVSNHTGGLGGGHYTAYGKNKFDGKWHYFDDSSVKSASEDKIVTEEAYVLFYQRRDGNDPSKAQPSASLGGDPAARLL